MQVLSAQDLGRTNRNRVLQALVDNGPLSRADLARELNVTRASAGSIINTLIEDGVLAPGAVDEPVGRGKPPTPLWFARTAGLSGAVSIQPDHAVAGIVNARGDVVAAERVSLEAHASYGTLRELIVQLAQSVFQDAEIGGLGLAVPAQCNSAESEIELCTVIPALTHSSLPLDLAAATGRDVYLEQDVRALASAERWFGVGRGSSSLAAIQVDGGVGVGIVADGHLFPGSDVASPQFGHMCVDRHGLVCSCGSTGCWETVASTDWLLTEANRRGVEVSGDVLDCVVAAANESLVAAELLDEFLGNLAVGLITIQRLFRNRTIVLEGSLAHAPLWVVEKLHHLVTRDDRFSVAPPALKQSMLGPDALVLSAGATALSQELGVRL